MKFILWIAFELIRTMAENIFQYHITQATHVHYIIFDKYFFLPKFKLGIKSYSHLKIPKLFVIFILLSSRKNSLHSLLNGFG